MKRITRDRQLTPDEAEKYNAIRDEIEQEKPEINDHIRKRIPRLHDEGALSECFSQFPHRAMMVGQFHRWFAATTARTPAAEGPAGQLGEDHR